MVVDTVSTVKLAALQVSQQRFPLMGMSLFDPDREKLRLENTLANISREPKSPRKPITKAIQSVKG
jgi:hypothetical protein